MCPLAVVCFRKGDQVLWRGRSVVSPPRDQQDLDQLHPLCKHPGETTEGNAPEGHQIIQIHASDFLVFPPSETEASGE